MRIKRFCLVCDTDKAGMVDVDRGWWICDTCGALKTMPRDDNERS